MHHRAGAALNVEARFIHRVGVILVVQDRQVSGVADVAAVGAGVVPNGVDEAEGIGRPKKDDRTAVCGLDTASIELRDDLIGRHEPHDTREQRAGVVLAPHVHRRPKGPFQPDGVVAEVAVPEAAALHASLKVEVVGVAEVHAIADAAEGLERAVHDHPHIRAVHRGVGLVVSGARDPAVPIEGLADRIQAGRDVDGALGGSPQRVPRRLEGCRVVVRDGGPGLGVVCRILHGDGGP